jgi:uncharacterized coiled-coil protein SlyX
MVTMAQRIAKVEHSVDELGMDVKQTNRDICTTNGKLDVLIKKFDDLPVNFVTRREHDIYIKIISAIGVTLLVAMVTLMFKIFTATSTCGLI